MSSPRNGEGRLAPANVEKSQQDSNTDERSAPVRQCASVRPLERRRKAADRSTPLGDTGNVRDPWLPWRPEQLSEKQIQAAAEAAGHLLELNLTPMFDLEMLRALWRAGFRSLVDTLRGGRQ